MKECKGEKTCPLTVTYVIVQWVGSVIGHNSEYWMSNACNYLTCQVAICREPQHVCTKLANFIQWAHLHTRANGCCKKTKRVDMGDLIIFSFSVRENSGITTAIEIYTASPTESDSMNGGITTLHEIYITTHHWMQHWLIKTTKFKHLCQVDEAHYTRNTDWIFSLRIAQ